MSLPSPLTVAEFQATFLEFRESSPTLIENTMLRATRAISQTVWCAQWKDGVYLWTAHRLKQMSFGTTTAAAKAAPMGFDDDYSTTTYGREFQTIRNSIVGAYPGAGTW